MDMVIRTCIHMYKYGIWMCVYRYGNTNLCTYKYGNMGVYVHIDIAIWMCVYMDMIIWISVCMYLYQLSQLKEITFDTACVKEN